MSVLSLLFVAICSMEKGHTIVNNSVSTLKGRLKPENLYIFTSHIIFLKQAVYYLVFICGEDEKFFLWVIFSRRVGFLQIMVLEIP